MAKRKRIMMISTHGYVSAAAELGKTDTGGQVVHVLELSKSLARLGYPVDILTRRFEAQPREERVANGVRILRLPCGGKDFIRKEVLCDAIPEWVENVTGYLTKRSNQYLLINSHYWDAGLAGQALAKRFGIPHLHTPHSIGAWKRDNMDGDPETLERQYNFHRRIREEKVIYDECDAIVATTPLQLGILRAGDYDVDPRKVVVIPPGYDDTRFFPVSRAQRATLKQEYGYSGRVVLALGRMARNKGYDLLLQAMPVVFKRVEDVTCLLAVGSEHPDDQERRQVQDLQDLARQLGIQDRVVFRGYIPDEELADHYRLADVFALSSRYEPFGMTAVEAMACGTPTVITTEGGLWEQVRWGVESLYVSPSDPEAFGFAIYAVLTIPRLADELAKYGPQKARAFFTWIGIAQQLLRVVENLPGAAKEA